MNDHLETLFSRRSVLRQGACAAVGLAGLGSQLLTVRAMAATLEGRRFDEYRALVCVFLFGGNDSGNTLIPLSGGAQNYEDYADQRGNLAIPRSQLDRAWIGSGDSGGRRFALHPALRGVRKLYRSGHAAVVANVGTLLAPTTKESFELSSVPIPRQLFAHDVQQEQWQLSRPDAIDGLGWGGRLADLLQSAAGTNDPTVSMNISVAGVNRFLAGRRVGQFVLGEDGPPRLAEDFDGAVERAYVDMLSATRDPNQPNQHAMVKTFRDIASRAVTNNSTIRDLLERGSRLRGDPPEDNELARQLSAVARLIEVGRSGLGHNRQVFFVALGGFDHHDGLVDQDGAGGPHGELLRQVDEALTYFWSALGQLGQRDNVTTFTASDFGRTFASNGNGSDHGWGGHHIVIGGRHLAGGKVFGEFPDIRIGGPQDTGQGRFIPTTSVDAYGFEFARWMGVPLSEMRTVFPNIDRFLDVGNPGTYLGMLR
ncbi:MAG: DUF1501 domain-containing protein [Planctomycetota bacterium]